MLGHLPSAPPIVRGGKKYRQCSAVIVFNEASDVLVGERAGKPGNWQLPQGGVDEGETSREAADREMYEEVGLKLGDLGLTHLFDVPTEKDACFYDVKGSWLAKQGFAGQHLAFSVYLLPSGKRDPSTFCNLTDANGHAEFSKVKWAKLEDVTASFSKVKWAKLEDVTVSGWEPKRLAY
eukprot:gene9033-13982_t